MSQGKARRGVPGSRSRARRLLFWGVVGLIGFYLLCPFYWAINSSLKADEELLATPATFWPHAPTLRNYITVARDPAFQRGLFNSALVAASTVALSLVAGSFAAYAMGRLRFRGRQALLYLILAMTLFPGVVILVPLFDLMRRFHLDAIVGMILSYMIFTLPFTIWLLTASFKALPVELLQAAEVDGATPLQAFFRILLPLAAPALVTAGLLAFIVAWNEYLFALTFSAIQQSDRTVPVAIAFYLGVGPYQGELMAASVLVTAPIVVLVLLFQQRIVSGLTAGALD